MTTLSRAKLLILDGWGPEALSAEQARDLLEIIDDRMDAGSIPTSCDTASEAEVVSYG